MDEFTTNHLIAWTRNVESDEVAQFQLFELCYRFATDHPSVLSEGYDWPTIARIAEREAAAHSPMYRALFSHLYR